MIYILPNYPSEVAPKTNSKEKQTCGSPQLPLQNLIPPTELKPPVLRDSSSPAFADIIESTGRPKIAFISLLEQNFFELLLSFATELTSYLEQFSANCEWNIRTDNQFGKI